MIVRMKKLAGGAKGIGMSLIPGQSSSDWIRGVSNKKPGSSFNKTAAKMMLRCKFLRNSVRMIHYMVKNSRLQKAMASCTSSDMAERLIELQGKQANYQAKIVTTEAKLKRLKQDRKSLSGRSKVYAALRKTRGQINADIQREKEKIVSSMASMDFKERQQSILTKSTEYDAKFQQACFDAMDNLHLAYHRKLEAETKIESLLADPPPADSGRNLVTEVGDLEGDIAQAQAEQWSAYNEIALLESLYKYQPKLDNAYHAYLEKVQDIDHKLLSDRHHDEQDRQSCSTESSISVTSNRTYRSPGIHKK